MQDRSLTIRRARSSDTLALLDDRDRPLRSCMLLAEVDGRPLAVVGVDGAALRADPIARAEYAVRVLLMYAGRVISEAKAREAS